MFAKTNDFFSTQQTEKKSPSTRTSVYLISPKKYFYPMNILQTRTFLTLEPTKSVEKISNSFEAISSSPLQRPKSSKVIRRKFEKIDSKSLEKKINSQKGNMIKLRGFQLEKPRRSANKLYQPIVVSVNSRSKFTIFTTSRARNSSAVKMVSFGDCLKSKFSSPSNKKCKKLRFLVPEFNKN